MKLNSKKTVLGIVTYLSFCLLWSQNNSVYKGKHLFGLGVNSGLVIGDLSDNYTATLGLDVVYLYGVSNRFFIGGTTGLAQYFSDEPIIQNGIALETEDLQFIPITGSIRFSPFRNFFGGTDIGYAFGLQSNNEGGFYVSPRATYFINGKVPVFLGYRNISLEDNNLASLLLGVGFTF